MPEQIEAPTVNPVTDISTPHAPTRGGSKGKTQRARRSEFPKYVPGKSCLQLGRKEHDFVVRPNGSKICKRCGSTVSVKSAESQKKSKKSKKGKSRSSNQDNSSENIADTGVENN